MAIRRRSLVAVAIAAAMIVAMAGWLAVSRARHCGLPATGTLTPAQVDGRSAIACDLVGRTVSDGPTGMTIPHPGAGVGVNADGPSGGSSLSLQVCFFGRISVD